MWQRRETVEHPFATLKMRMGATHFHARHEHNRRSTAPGGDEGLDTLLVSPSRQSRTSWHSLGRLLGGENQYPKRREAAKPKSYPPSFPARFYTTKTRSGGKPSRNPAAQQAADLAL